jgi:hypothetical protein
MLERAGLVVQAVLVVPEENQVVQAVLVVPEENQVVLVVQVVLVLVVPAVAVWSCRHPHH